MMLNNTHSNRDAYNYKITLSKSLYPEKFESLIYNSKVNSTAYREFCGNFTTELPLRYCEVGEIIFDFYTKGRNNALRILPELLV